MDIKRPKYSRPHVALPGRRRINLRTSLAKPAHAFTAATRPHSDKPHRGRRFKVGLIRDYWHGFYRWLKSARLPEPARLYLPSPRQHPALARVGWGFLAFLMVGSILIEFFNWRLADVSYDLSPKAQTLLSQANPLLAKSLKYDAKSGIFRYNEAYVPGGEVAGQIASPKFTASFSKEDNGSTVTDPVTQTSVSFKPEFGLAEPRQDRNRLIYPLKGRDAVKVYSLKSIGMKEDIILNSFQGDELSFDYRLELADGTEARLEPNGSLAIYGAQKELLGNVSTGSEKDAELLKKARQKAPKRTLLFTFPRPFIVEFGQTQSKTKAWFELKEDVLTLHASGLQKADYPLTIDPSIYIETAAKLMRGNNETNIDFDVDDELIQKSQTTGARFDDWDSTMALNEGRWNGGTAMAGGYVYSVGGIRSTIETEIFSTVGNDTFTVPTGITAVTVKMWGGGGGGGGGSTNADGGTGGGAGFTQATLSVTPSEVLTVRVGGGGGAGDFSTGTAGALSGDGGGGGGHSEVERSGTSLVIAPGGGGGGGGDNSSATAGGAGGPGGGSSGTAGSASGSAGGGGGGTTGAGGAAGTGGGNSGAAGAAESGGAGADGRSAAGADGSKANGGTASGGAGGNGDMDSGFGAGGGGASGRFGGGGGSGSLTGNAGGGGGGGGSGLATGTDTTLTAGSGTAPGNSGDSQRSGAGDGGTGGVGTNSGTDGADGRVIITYSTATDDTAAYVRDNGAGGATSTTLDIGTADTNRLVVVMANDESTGTNLTGATVDGKACNLVTRANNSNGAGNHQEMWYCDESDLTTSNGTVTVAITGGDTSWAVHAHLYTGVSQTGPTDSGIDQTSVGGSTVTVNGIDVPQNGLVVMGGGHGDVGTWSSWTSPLTERSDGPNPTSAIFGTASDIETTAQTNKTYVGTASSANILRGTGIVASWDHGVIGGANEYTTEVYWARLNTTNGDIESPNPGAGACAEWCTNGAYDLPSARAGFSMVAYNGFLYVLGGLNSSGVRTSTVYIAKLGANGEPSLWHPTDTNKNNWVYWYSATALNSERTYAAAVAYNNRMYLLGGQTNASAGGVTTVEKADINPMGTFGTWSATGTQALTSVRHGHTAHVYNDRMYLIGGNSNGTLQSTVYYSRLNSDGTMNNWVQTSSFTTARSSWGGNYSVIWGGYVYLAGGCSAVNGSGYCTTVASDIQLASINADGSLAEWGTIAGVTNARMSYGLAAWRNSLYRVGGCGVQDTSNGDCTTVLDTVDQGAINPAGEVSTVNISVPSGTSPCSGGSPFGCDLPPVGDDAGEGGQLLSMSAIMNGYLYVIGGCIALDCDGADAGAADDFDVTGNISYVSIDSAGRLTAPGSCGGTSYGAWCVDSTNKINNTGSNTTDGVAAAGVATFNNRIYVVGGLTGGALSTNIYYNSVNANGTLAGAWSSVDTTDAGLTEDVSYTYAFTRANPASAGTYPGNLYILGGCGSNTGGAGCGSNDYETEVYKCNITTAGAIETADANDCTTSGQLQIDSTPGAGGTDGLGIHSGTVYANYIFLVGGFSQAESDKDDVLYARIDNSNNIVAVSGSDWIESPNKLSVGRRRGFSFGYNGHIYSVGGYDDTGGGTIIPFIEWSKMNVSDGSIGAFQTSNVTINQRWGLTMVVSNSYAYVIGGCDDGISPSGCNSFENSVQTFQLYNNDSGAVNNFTANANNFTTATDRIGASATVLNGYLYVAGGCTTNTSDTCTAASSSVQYAAISASDGTLGTWSAGGSLPAVRTWGSLESAGGTLYYIGGQDSTAGNEQTTVYYTTGISSGNPTWSGTAASNGLPAARTRLSSAVWNNRLYVVGGLDSGAAVTSTVYVSPQLNSGGNITTAWASSTAFNVARTGAAVTAYANNLYLFGGFDGTNYLNDVQFTQINSDGTVDSWTYTTSLPGALRDARAFSANGYMYLVGGRSAATTCPPNTIIAPVSANTTIASGNNPTGLGEWYETNVKYTGDRYGAAVAYDDGKLYTMGGGCVAPLTTNRHYYSTVKSQPQVAKYSRMIDTDTDVFPNSWLLNGIDNSIGARWAARYRSMNDTDGVATDCGTADMTTWGQETNFGDVTLGNVAPYVPRDGSGNNINCARYYYFFISIDASKTFGYPEDVNRGPTITDLSLFFTSDPSKRLRHGKTFTGGELQPHDTPCRQSNDPDCPLP